MTEAALPGVRRTARVISVMNQKGGVGKTTTTLNLGAALALQGRRVLLIDLDPQANLTHGVNRRAADLSQCIYELLISPKPDAHALILHTDYERLDLLPSHIDVSGAEIELVPMIGRETRLKRSVDVLRQEYDYILIDCLPALSLLTVNALVASDEALVPLQAHPFALEGLGKLFEVVGMIREALNASLRVSGVLVTLFDGRTNVSRETLERLIKDERLAPHLFETIVKVNIKIAESQNYGIPVVHYEPRSPGALAYVALCEELLEMESGCLASEARTRIRARRTEESAEAEEAVPAETDGPQAGAPESSPAEAAVTIIAAEGVAPLEAERPEPPPPPSAPPVEAGPPAEPKPSCATAGSPSSATDELREASPTPELKSAEPPATERSAVAEPPCATAGLPSSAADESRQAPPSPETADLARDADQPPLQSPEAPAQLSPPAPAPAVAKAEAEASPAPAAVAAAQGSATAVPPAEASGPQAADEGEGEPASVPLRQRLPDVTDPSFRPRLNLVPHPGPLPAPAVAPKTADESRSESGDTGT